MGGWVGGWAGGKFKPDREVGEGKKVRRVGGSVSR